MRRNETVLVYAVTGVLLVILAIAVIFGEEPAQAGTDSARTLSDRGDGKGLIETNAADLGITRVTPPAAVEPGGKAVEPGGKDAPKDVQKGKDDALRDALGDALGDALKHAPGDVPAAQGGQPTQESPNALAKNVDPIALPGRGTADEGALAPVPLVTRTIAQQVNRVLGTSRREGKYRVVTARSGDRLSTLVERWCGGLDQLPLVEALNEDLKPGEAIPGGRKVLVPWTDDEVLLVSLKQRKKKLAEIEQTKGELYTIKKGDSLWKIAVRRVGSRQAPAYIRAIVAGNPQLEDPDAVQEGQKIRLPSPSKRSPKSMGKEQG